MLIASRLARTTVIVGVNLLAKLIGLTRIILFFCRSEPAREKCLGDQKDLIMKKGRYFALRKGRTSLSGQYYHLIFSVKQRRPIFTDFIRARYLVHLMHRVDMQARAITLSYVVMPDHVHWLIKLNADSVSAVVQRLKSFYTKFEGENIWNKGFNDHGIRSDESLINVARYIVANPLRAGLVDNIGEYPHWDSVWLE
ncbi:REP-associated tyrosine transposase [Bermanella sp. WJH001]|uniref:REP-associated tyrosine transposase n=1 Tax=Bermanella sp. WJH001 TaxID=3048005 RepID=UPI0024BE43B4|nr:transposase [Bermanella sp. WJH001]MDJ1537321.1 transposase [Bermanella sp. WJH001]